jgi:hypothetical protein
MYMYIYIYTHTHTHTHTYGMPLISGMSVAPGLFLISIRAERLKLPSGTHCLLKLEIILKLCESVADSSGRAV